MENVTLVGSVVVALVTLAGVLYTTRSTARGQAAGSAIDGLDRLSQRLQARVTLLEASQEVLAEENRALRNRQERMARLSLRTIDALLAYIAKWGPADQPAPPEVPAELLRLLNGED